MRTLDEGLLQTRSIHSRVNIPEVHRTYGTGPLTLITYCGEANLTAELGIKQPATARNNDLAVTSCRANDWRSLNDGRQLAELSARN
jgi:hypothetical protein